jgi:hypothetical protein
LRKIFRRRFYILSKILRRDFSENDNPIFQIYTPETPVRLVFTGNLQWFNDTLAMPHASRSNGSAQPPI